MVSLMPCIVFLSFLEIFSCIFASSFTPRSFTLKSTISLEFLYFSRSSSYDFAAFFTFLSSTSILTFFFPIESALSAILSMSFSRLFVELKLKSFPITVDSPCFTSFIFAINLSSSSFADLADASTFTSRESTSVPMFSPPFYKK